MTTEPASSPQEAGAPPIVWDEMSTGSAPHDAAWRAFRSVGVEMLPQVGKALRLAVDAALASREAEVRDRAGEEFGRFAAELDERAERPEEYDAIRATAADVLARTLARAISGGNMTPGQRTLDLAALMATALDVEGLLRTPPPPDRTGTV